MKKILSLIIALNIVLLSWAMPQFDSYLPDISGEYVYYKDNTFLRESYIGILYYNDSTLQLRYYAPRDVEQKLPENEVVIAISMNPENTNMEFTGEQILTTVIPGTENVDIVNYLHDLLYDFTKVRRVVENIDKRDIIINQELLGFGGRVSITYDCTIPIFNIKNITKTTGESLLHCVTTGRLEDNNDKSFDNFKGFPLDNTKKTKDTYSKGKNVEYNFYNQKITLDNSWQQAAANFWLRGNDAVLTLSTINSPKPGDANYNENAFIRKFIQSTSYSFSNFDTLIIKKDKDNRLLITYDVYKQMTDKIVVNKKIISPDDKYAFYDMLGMPIYKGPYLTNKKYYDKILEGYEN